MSKISLKFISSIVFVLLLVSVFSASASSDTTPSRVTINFDDLPVDTLVGDQYQNQGMYLLDHADSWIVNPEIIGSGKHIKGEGISAGPAHSGQNALESNGGL